MKNTQSSITVSAPGKIHLMGEHAVVYGKPALLAAIDKRCFVELTKRDDKKIVLIASNTTDFVTITEEEILTKDKKNLQLFDYVMLIMQQALLYYHKSFPSGFSLVINNQIPQGRGLGSSAAIAVSVAGAITLFLRENFDKEKINRFSIEGTMNFWKQMQEFKAGKNNSWAIRWYASIFLKGGLTLNPSASLINNIGNDGSGIHSNNEDMYQVKIAKKAVKKFPTEIKEDRQAYQAIKHFLKHRKGSLFQRGVRFLKQLREKYIAK